MGIKDVKLGPKSRVLQQPSAAEEGQGDGRLGCGCGKYFVVGRRPVGNTVAPDGWTHRYGKPCLPPGAPERAGREGDQALPTPGAQSVFAEVRRRLGEREAIGIRRYGTTLETFNDRDAGRDLEDELLDALAYATQARLEHAAVVEALLVLSRGFGQPASDVERAALELAAKLEASRVR